MFNTTFQVQYKLKSRSITTKNIFPQSKQKHWHTILLTKLVIIWSVKFKSYFIKYQIVCKKKTSEKSKLTKNWAVKFF